MTIGKDKLYHATCGFVIALFVSFIVTVLSNGSTWSAFMAGTLSSFALGLGKEYGDYAHVCRWDWYDLLATFIGGVVGSSAIFIVLP